MFKFTIQVYCGVLCTSLWYVSMCVTNDNYYERVLGAIVVVVSIKRYSNLGIRYFVELYRSSSSEQQLNSKATRRDSCHYASSHPTISIAQMLFYNFCHA